MTKVTLLGERKTDDATDGQTDTSLPNLKQLKRNYLNYKNERKGVINNLM